MKHHYTHFFKLVMMLVISGIIFPASAQQNAPGENQQVSLNFAEPGFLPAEYPGKKAPLTDGSTAYGNNVWTNKFFSLDTDLPAIVNIIGNMTTQTTSGDFHPDETGFMYVMDINTNYLGKIDISTGETVDSVLVPVPLTDAIWTVLTINKTSGEFYGIATNGNESSVYSINPVTGATALAIETGLAAVISGTFDGDGLLWMFEILNDDIYTLDLLNQNIDFVGNVGFNGNFAQGMGYDPMSDDIYMAAYEDTVGAQLRMLNRLTGEATFIEDLPGETTAFGFPGGTGPVIYYTVEEVYDSPDLLTGDIITVVGNYTNPDYNLLIDFFGDWDVNEFLRNDKTIQLSGVTPNNNTWNGGYIAVTGEITIGTDPDPVLPDDDKIVSLEVTGVEEFLDGSGPLNKSVGNEERQAPHNLSRDCDSCKFAIFISGGLNVRNNHDKYWKSLAALYASKTTDQGYCPENILVNYYQGAGDDNSIPAANIKKADSTNISNNFKEISKRVAACTKKGKKSTFQKLVFNHGKSNGDINLLNNEVLKNDLLKDLQQEIIDSCASTIQDEFLQCYAGHSVDAMNGLDPRNKATIYINSSADKTPSHSPHGVVDKYLQGKIDKIGEGKSYEEAVVAGKMAYDAYLQGRINYAHQRAQFYRNNPGVPRAARNLAYWVQDSTNRANRICKSRNVTIVPFTEYCQWQRFVVPPGGQLVLQFDGEDNNCGNVTVYKEDPETGEKTKVKEWNWNIEGSDGYQAGNNQRVINGDADNPCIFWVHNDNNGDGVTVKGSANGDQALNESASNSNAFAGSSYGGDDNSAEEFGIITEPSYFYEGIDQLPLNLQNLPGYLGPEYVQGFGCSFNITQSDPYWTDMSLHLDVVEVVQPGDLIILFEGIGNTFLVPINEPGEYNIPIGDMSFLGSGLMQMLADNVSFSVDSWGLRSFYGQEQPFEQIIQLEPGWAGISSFVEPFDPFLPVLINPVMDQFTLLQNDQGNLFWPDEGINTLQIWDPSQGYVINMQEAAALPVLGMPIEFPAVFINEGWNYVPVLVPESYPPDLLFGSLEGFVMAKEIAGPGVFWPEYNINTIGNLMPGRAYNAFSLQSGETFYEYFPLEKSEVVEPDVQEFLESPWNPVAHAPNSHTVVFDFNQSILQTGDVIGVFTQNNWCAGFVRIDDPIQNLAMVVNATDPSRANITGFVSDEELSFRLYREATGESFEIDPVYDPTMNTGEFEENGLSVVTDLKISPTGVSALISSDLKIYPNPNKGLFTIESGFEKMELSVYNAFGEIVYHESASGNTNLNLTGQPNGTYFVKFTSERGTWFEKVVVY